MSVLEGPLEGREDPIHEHVTVKISTRDGDSLVDISLSKNRISDFSKYLKYLSRFIRRAIYTLSTLFLPSDVVSLSGI